jgi:membrane protein
MPRIICGLREAAWSALRHSIFSMAKATAYSAILSIFPALLVLTTVVASSNSDESIASLIQADLEHILPGDTIELIRAYIARQIIFDLCIWSGLRRS